MGRRRASLIALIAGAGVLTATVGLAQAAIPDGGGVIHGCYDAQSGHLRVTDSESGSPKACGKNEIAVSWNQQGPQGPIGPQGAAGASGTSLGFGRSTGLIHLAGEQVILSVNLAAGKYVVNAHVAVETPSFGSETVAGYCTLGGDRADSYADDAGDWSGDELPLTAVIDHPGGALNLSCKEVTGDFDVSHAYMTGIRVDSFG
jgi:hypothetical protein